MRCAWLGITLSVLGHNEQKGIKDMQNWEVFPNFYTGCQQSDKHSLAYGSWTDKCSSADKQLLFLVYQKVLCFHSDRDLACLERR